MKIEQKRFLFEKLKTWSLKVYKKQIKSTILLKMGYLKISKISLLFQYKNNSDVLILRPN